LLVSFSPPTRILPSSFFILQSIPKTRAHLPAGKWTNPINLLWDSPPNPGPFYHVFREWTASGHSRNINALVDVLLCHYGEFDTLENPYPSTIQALAKCLSNEAAVATLKDRQRRDAITRCVQARSLENDYQEGVLGMLPEGTGVDAPHVRGTNPSRQQELQEACSILVQNRGPPTHTSVLWCRAVILPTPLYHQRLLLTAVKTIPPTWPLAQLCWNPRRRVRT
jgi:hypothetical protein